jgi:AcrR family transcriptional regulator
VRDVTEQRPTKRERTRRKLLDAGMHVIAERGEALTASDVVTAAEVSNGTFYNHFVDRDDFIRALAHESLTSLTERSADDTKGADPAWRFAVASVRVLDAGARDPRWGRAVLRLNESPTPLHAAVQRHLRADLAEGHRTGRFTHGDDPVTVDLVSGTLMAALRRLVSPESVSATSHNAAIGESGGGFVAAVVARLLEAIGVEPSEAAALATAAHHSDGTQPARPALRPSRSA